MPAKNCTVCGVEYVPGSGASRYCPACAKKIRREKSNESKRRSRERNRQACIELSAKNDRLIWNGGRDREEELLANCYFNSMKLAMDNGIRSIAFPSISTGVYSFPVELAAKIAVHTVNRFLQDKPDWFDLVEWVLFDTHTESVYESEVDKIYE